jgi:hypothetical protein
MKTIYIDGIQKRLREVINHPYFIYHEIVTFKFDHDEDINMVYTIEPNSDNECFEIYYREHSKQQIQKVSR